MTSHWVPEQSASHQRLLDSPRRVDARARFDAIVVPTNRPVEWLGDCLRLAHETAIPLIVVCSKRITRHEVIDAAARVGVEAFAVDLTPADSPGISFATSTDDDLLTASSGRTRDLSTKRNLGLVIARMLGWRRLMFLDDDIFDVSPEDVDALATALSDHGVSVLIPDEYPDNSVACHAHRLGGGQQGKFAGAGGMGVRCDRDDLAFFPNIYNEDWLFFSEEAASRRIALVGESRQRDYDPYADPQRAVKEEFGDLLAEGLYARLDAERGIVDVDIAYWADFIKSRRHFLSRVAESLMRHPDRDQGNQEGRTIRAAEISIRAARGRLEQINPELCRRFIDVWQADLIEWRRYLTGLPHVDSVASALNHLGLDYAESA